MDQEKQVDESWKEAASQEKSVLDDVPKGEAEEKKILVNDFAKGEDEQPNEVESASTAGDAGGEQAIEVNFLNYISSLAFQAMIFMGEIPNSMTNKSEKNLMQAKFLIDTLSMLQEKTSGNLNDQEKDLLENSVYELQMKFVQTSSDDSSSEGGEGA